MNYICALSDAAIFAGVGAIGMIVIIIGLGLLALSVLVSVYQWLVYYRTRKYNRQKVACGLTSEQVASSLLQNLGYTETKVEVLGFWKGLFVGNHYNEKKDVVYIKKYFAKRATLAAVALVTQKVAEVDAHKKGNKNIAKRSRIQRSGLIAPIVFIPVVVIGVALDYVLRSQIGIMTVIATVVALAYFIYGLVGVALAIKVEKFSAKKALEFFEKTNVLNESERKDAEKLYKTYITSYIINYIYMLVQVIRLVFKLLFQILKIFGKKK